MCTSPFPAYPFHGEKPFNNRKEHKKDSWTKVCVQKTILARKQLSNFNSFYKYDLTGTSENTFFALKILLGWNGREQIENMKTREVSPATMNAKDMETGVQYYFVVGNHDMPENVLGISD